MEKRSEPSSRAEVLYQGKLHYGWARLNVTIKNKGGVPEITGLLTGYAYETIPNKPIIAGKKHNTYKAALGQLARGCIRVGSHQLPNWNGHMRTEWSNEGKGFSTQSSETSVTTGKFRASS